jgi:two-component system LytT family response regulator
VVFLDVRMPGRDGLEVVEAIDPGLRPLVVFVTAHEDRAARAFDVHAVDYVLKPYDDLRFADTLRRVRQRLGGDPAALTSRLEALLESLGRGAPEAGRRAPLDRFAIRTRGRVRILRAEAVDWIEAEGDYARLHGGGESYLVEKSLKQLEARLDPTRFARIHRSAIVNLDRVEDLKSRDGRDYELRLRDGTRLRLSRTHRAAFESRLGDEL